GLFEEARRQWPRCSMALNWCLNEPWPTAANNSLISWPCEPKPALDAVRDAGRPALVSAKLVRFLWKEGDDFDPQLWLLNNGNEAIPAGEASLWLGEVCLLRWDHPEVPARTNLAGPRACHRLGAPTGPILELKARREGSPALDSTYRLAWHTPGPDPIPDWNQNN
ncbi:MAG: hypothetical protein MH204_01180, partial [Fimbriimonadaceae bacterium]|nr:hypothetical protein [Fimbriimonadaceae bacterium]